MVKIKREKGPGYAIFEKLQKEAGIIEGKMGWDSSAVYPNGQKTAQVAAIQEYGDPMKNIPPRLGMRDTIAKNKNIWKSNMNKGARAILSGKETTKSTFTKFMLGAEGDFVKHIATVQNPPLAESTIAARLRKRKDKLTVGLLTKPLIDTGYMLATFTSTVNNEVIPGSNKTRKG